MNLTIPELSLVILIGPSGAGKSTFARKHFLPTEVLSSDYCRGLISDDENDQTVSAEAFEVLRYIAAKRLEKGRLTVIDATNVRAEDRQGFVALAREYHCLPVALVFDLPEKLCQERNAVRPDRDFGAHVIRSQRSALRRGMRGRQGLKREGFRYVYTFASPEEVDAALIERQPLWNNKKHEHGPFDIIGDVHGCYDELIALLGKLGYAAADGAAWQHPEGRKLIFVGDLVDRGPKTPECLRLVMECAKAETAICAPGNHDVKFMRAMWGKNVKQTHGLAESIEQIRIYEEGYRGFGRVAADFIDSLVSHYVLDDGKLVVAHAGMKQAYQGRGSGKVREFALYGETTGETDEFGLPVRHNWAAEYRGNAKVVYGHTPVPEAEWLNRTINIDTGCVFGRKLTALRYPELETVSVPAAKTYCEPARPFLTEDVAEATLSAQQAHDDVLDIADVTGKRIISTRLRANITIRAENAAAALEVMSRFAADPRWLIYLPPTMSPCETSTQPDYLEYPTEAFSYFRSAGVGRVICQEKHMGSRAVVVICKSADAARSRFGVSTGEAGIIFTRTGRRFFDDSQLQSDLLGILRGALDATGLWERFATDWACFDCELMPWSAKAQALLQEQYAALAAAGRTTLAASVATLMSAQQRGIDTTALLNETVQKQTQISAFTDAYRHYCWPVVSIDDLKLAPFHLLATETGVHIDRDHAWHMQTLSQICGHAAPVLHATRTMEADLSDAASEQRAIDWWIDMTAAGGEGMVVKPRDFVVRGKRGIVQPAIKCRGREYLRIIYGPEYDTPENLARLRARRLGSKRSLALREFALGVESLERFVRREPLRRVHECAFGVLAMESEPVDPRL